MQVKKHILPKQSGQDAPDQHQGGDYDETVLQSDSYEHLRRRIVS